LDVHPPHEPIHTWRDFLLHLATITVGLLIALGLEGAVEYLHHRHIVREARENIRREIEQNQQAVKENLGNLDKNKQSMKDDLVELRSLRQDPSAKGKHLTYEFVWSSFNESAWQSARDSGALTYMPTEEVQRYADLYDGQEVATAQSTSIVTDDVQVYAPLIMEDDDARLSREEVQEVMHGTAVTYTMLGSLRQIVEQLGRLYAETLKK
jgi:hypothetical protein